MRGAREAQCVVNRNGMEVTKEFVSPQHTAQGDVVVAYLEGEDPDKAMHRMIDSDSDSEYAR